MTEDKKSVAKFFRDLLFKPKWTLPKSPPRQKKSLPGQLSLLDDGYGANPKPVKPE